MKISRCCLASSAIAVVLAAVAVWQFSVHIDQGVTLAHSETGSDERAQVIEQLRVLALDQLRGKSRGDIVRLVETQGRGWFDKDGAIVADNLVFKFDAQGLAGIDSLFDAPDQ
jgi:hypothetical protein